MTTGLQGAAADLPVMDGLPTAEPETVGMSSERLERLDEVMQAALSPLAFTVGTDFKPARHRDLDSVLHVDQW